jgi:hypothetical protein
MLKLIDHVLLDDSDNFLKNVECPKGLKPKDFGDATEVFATCNVCDSNVVNTKYFSEKSLVALIRSDPDVCLIIHKANPMFKFENSGGVNGSRKP